MGRLTCLQTLPIFVVGRDEGFRIKELGPLNNLRGEIGIYGLVYVKDQEEAKSAKLKEKEIFKLGLYWKYPRVADNYDNDDKVLEGLQPHQNLKSLTIKFYKGKKFASWMLTSRDPDLDSLCRCCLADHTQNLRNPENEPQFIVGHRLSLGDLENSDWKK